MQKVSKTYRDLMKVNCTGCGYCLPCPAGVDIPGCFDVYNNFYFFDDLPTAKRFYMFRQLGLINKPSGASLCINCGQCVKKCPQDINIPVVLKDVARKFEGFIPKMTVWAFRQLMPFYKWWSLRK